MNKLEA